MTQYPYYRLGLISSPYTGHVRPIIRRIKKKKIAKRTALLRDPIINVICVAERKRKSNRRTRLSLYRKSILAFKIPIRESTSPPLNYLSIT